MIRDPEALLSELEFKAIKSSGPGGQHVNKVSSKVVLSFDISRSGGLNTDEKERLVDRLRSRLTKDQILVMSCDDTRSQHKNKELVIQRFLALIEQSLVVPAKRKPTKKPKAADRKRLEDKRRKSGLKASRKKPDTD